MRHVSKWFSVVVILGCLLVFVKTSNSALANSIETKPLNASTSSPVEYILPYPGLLPDHPLYFLRALRDTIQTLLVSDPLKKADFYLLQADKGVAASVMLTQKPETHTLASAVAIESQESFGKAIDAVVDAEKQGLDTKYILDRLIVANKKHTETLIELQQAVAEKDKESFGKAITNAKQFEKKVKSLLPDK